MKAKRIISAFISFAIILSVFSCVSGLFVFGAEIGGNLETGYETIAEGETKTAVISAGGEKAYFAFTPETDGTYAFYSSSEEDTYGSVYSFEMNELAFDDDSGEATNFKVIYKMSAGETYILAASYLNEQITGSFSVSLIKCPSATAIDMKSTLTGYAGETYYLQYNLVPEDAAYETVTWASSDKNVVAVTSYGMLDFLCEGTAEVTATSENGLTAVCLVTVKTPEIIYENTPATVTIQNNEEQYYSFTPAEDGDYLFYCYNYSNQNSAYIRIKASNGSGVNSGYRVVANLIGGEEYRIAANFGSFSEPDGSYDLTVIKAVSAEGFTYGNSDVELYINKEIRLNATFSPFNSKLEGVVWTAGDSTVVQIGYNGLNEAALETFCDIKGLKSGKTTVTATSENGLSAEWEVVVKGYNTISLGETKTVTVGYEKQTEYLYFTPQTTGYYSFYSSSDFDTKGYLLDYDMHILLFNDDGGENNNFLLTYKLTAGTTYILAAEGYSDMTFDVSVEKTPAAESIVMQSSVRGFVGGNGYLYVNFYPLNTAAEDITWYSSDESVVTVSNNGPISGKLTYLSAGTATVTAVSENGLTAVCDVVSIAPQPLYEYTPATVVITENREQYYRFTPAESGEYIFYCDNYSNSNTAYMQLFDSDGERNMGSKITSYLYAGNAYYIAVRYGSYTNAGNGSFNLNVTKPVAATSLSCNGSGDVEMFVNTSQTLIALLNPFNAKYEGVIWSSSDETVVAVNYDYYGDGDKNTMYYCEVKALSVGTATITAETVSGLKAEFNVTVKDFGSISQGEIKTVEIASGGTSAYYKFTPESDGYYSFRSGSNKGYDTYGTIYDAYMNPVAYDDDSGGNMNFAVKYYLTAGETYILEARYNDSGMTGSFEVAVNKSMAVTNLEIETLPDKTEYIKGNYSIDFGGLSVKVTWEDGTTSLWDYNNAYGNYVIGDEYIRIYWEDFEDYLEFSVSCGGLTEYYRINLSDSPVSSIEILGDTTISVLENGDGNWNKRWDAITGQNIEYFHYNYDLQDVTVQINFADGSRKIAKVYDVIGGYRIEARNDQFENPWVVGGNNYITVYYLGSEALILVDILKNPVESIEITGDKITLIENDNGYLGTRWDNEKGEEVPYFYYNVPAEMLRDVTVQINYANGEKKTGKIGDYVDGYLIGWDYNQYDNPWTAGGENYIIVNYLGSKANLKVDITQSPVDRIEIISAPTREYVYGDNSYGTTYSDGTYYFEPTDLKGLVFKVFYKDNTSKVFEITNGESEGELEGHTYSISYDGSTAQPGEFPVTLNYMGKSAEYNVLITGSKVASIEVTKLPEKTEVYENYSPDWNGLELTVHYTDGTSEVFTVTKENSHYEFNMNTGFICRFSFNGSEGYIGAEYLNVSRTFYVFYFDKFCRITGLNEKEDKEVMEIEAVTFNPAAKIAEFTVTYQDETTENIIFDNFVTNEQAYYSDGLMYSETDKGVIACYYSDSGNYYYVELLGKNIRVNKPDKPAGDLTGDDIVNEQDAIYLLFHYFFPEEYEINSDCDYNNDSLVDEKDALYLLYYTYFPKLYPINK